MTCKADRRGNLRKAEKKLRIEIVIEGCLDTGWAEWFEGLEIDQTTSGETVIAGGVADQAALYGLIGKLRDLGVKLLAITYQEQE